MCFVCSNSWEFSKHLQFPYFQARRYSWKNRKELIHFWESEIDTRCLNLNIFIILPRLGRRNELFVSHHCTISYRYWFELINTHQKVLNDQHFRRNIVGDLKVWNFNKIATLEHCKTRRKRNNLTKLTMQASSHQLKVFANEVE